MKMKLIEMTGTSFVMKRLKVVSDDDRRTVDWPHGRKTGPSRHSHFVDRRNQVDGSTHRFSMMARQAVAPLCARNGQRVGSIWLSKSRFLNRQLSIVCAVSARFRAGTQI